MSRYSQIGPQSRDQQSTMHALIKELLKVWSNKDVQDRYQNHFLIYLDTLSKKDAEFVIAKEIRLTLQNKSHYFKINRAMVTHKNILNQLRKALDQIDNAKDSMIIDMVKFASLLEQLRNNNLQVAEAALAFNYQCLESGKHPIQLIQGNNYVFEQLNNDNDMLKTSFLNEYIAFSSSYDPFFLFHYENTKKVMPNKIQNLSIQQLFNLSISKAYKFMRTQQQILQFLSGRVPNKLIYGKIKRFNYELIEQKLNLDSKTSSKSNVFKLENDAYIKRNLEQSIQADEYFERTKTEESPLKGAIFNVKHPKKTLNNFYLKNNRSLLPKLQSIKRPEVSANYSPVYTYKNHHFRKLSDEDLINKYTFKIRRRMSVRTNQSSQYNDKTTYLQSINKIMKNQQDFLKYSDHRKYSIDHRNQPLSPKRNNQYNQTPAQKLHDAEKQDPLANKFAQELSSMKIEPIIMEKPSESPSKIYKNFKLKAGNLKVSNVFIFLQQLNIKQYYRSTFQVENWENTLKNNQYYLHKFYINDVLEAVSLSCALPEGNILIKYWAPLETCDKQMSNFLFKKYLEYIERNSICKGIYYSLSEIPEVTSNGFVRYKQKILVRYRTLPQQIDTFSYFPFLTLNFSIVAVPKSLDKQILDNITINSNTTVPFNEKQFICFNYLLIANKITNLASGFSTFGSYAPNIKNFRDITTRLIKEEIYETSYNMELAIPTANLMTLRLRHPVYSPFFVANSPLLKFKGEEVYSDEESLVASLQMVKNTKLYFGKGFTSMTSMITVIKNRSSSNKRMDYCVKMFSKRMRGRLQSINLRDQYCFGDFQVVFEWIDFLKGRIDQDLSQFQLFGKQNYYVIIQIEKQFILGFQVKSQNMH